MPYIGRDGTIYEGSRPWGVAKIVDIFWGIINLFVAFFQTLIPGFNPDDSYGSGSNRGPRPPGPPRRNVRGLGKESSWQPPPCGASGG